MPHNPGISRLSYLYLGLFLISSRSKFLYDITDKLMLLSLFIITLCKEFMITYLKQPCFCDIYNVANLLWLKFVVHTTALPITNATYYYYWIFIIQL